MGDESKEPNDAANQSTGTNGTGAQTADDQSGQGSALNPDRAAPSSAEAKPQTDAPPTDEPNTIKQDSGEAAKSSDQFAKVARSAKDLSDDYSVQWSQCRQVLPVQDIGWSQKTTPEPADLDFLSRILAAPGLYVASDLHPIEIEQVLHWLPDYVSDFDADRLWFLSGRVDMDNVTAMATVQDVLSLLESEKAARQLFDPFGDQDKKPTLIVVELNDTRVTFDATQNSEIVKRLAKMGVSLFLLLSAGQQAVGPETDIMLWDHDLQRTWWRYFFEQVLAEQKIEPTEHLWNSCTEVTESALHSITAELEKPKRKGNLRDLLLDESVPFLNADPVDAIEKVVSEFKNQNEDERRLRELLAKVFPSEDNTEIGALDLTSTKVMPLEPHATAIFVIWASLQGSEQENLRAEWFNSAFDFQLRHMAMRDAEMRTTIAEDPSLRKKERGKKLKKLASPVRDLLNLDDLRKKVQMERLFRQLKVRRRLDRERGEVLAFGFVNAIDVIGDFLQSESPEYLSAQSDMYLSDWLTMFDPNESVNKVARRLAVRRFAATGALSEPSVRARIADDLINAFLTVYPEMARSYRNEKAGGMVAAIKLADFIVYWFDYSSQTDGKADAGYRESLQDLVSDVLVRIIQMSRGVLENRDLVFVRFLDRLTYAREDIFDMEKLVRTVGNSAPSSLQSMVLSFFDQLGSLYDKDVGEAETTSDTPARGRAAAMQRRRASRLQYQLFDVVKQELTRVKGEYQGRLYPKFLAGLATRVLSNSLIRANELDYRSTQTPKICSDRMLSRIFEEPDGVKRFVSILLSEPVRDYPALLLGDLYGADDLSKVSFQIEELWQLSFQQSLIGLKVDAENFGEEADNVAEEKTKIRQHFRAQRIGVQQAELLMQEDNASALRSHSFRLLLELHGLLACSGRTEFLSQLVDTMQRESDVNTDRPLFLNAKAQHRAYLLNLCTFVRQSYVDGYLSIDEKRLALDTLMKRVEVSKTLTLLKGNSDSGRPK